MLQAGSSEFKLVHLWDLLLDLLEDSLEEQLGESQVQSVDRIMAKRLQQQFGTGFLPGSEDSD